MLLFVQMAPGSQRAYFQFTTSLEPYKCLSRTLMQDVPGFLSQRAAQSGTPWLSHRHQVKTRQEERRRGPRALEASAKPSHQAQRADAPVEMPNSAAQQARKGLLAAPTPSVLPCRPFAPQAPRTRNRDTQPRTCQPPRQTHRGEAPRAQSNTGGCRERCSPDPQPRSALPSHFRANGKQKRVHSDRRLRAVKPQATRARPWRSLFPLGAEGAGGFRELWTPGLGLSVLSEDGRRA